MTDDAAAVGDAATLGLRWGAATHTGRVRSVNQDAVLAGPTIFAVADGMGGHAAGEVASSLAVATLARAAGDGEFVDADAVVDAVRDANERIVSEAQANSAAAGMGTTVALVAACGRELLDDLLVVNVGDSRVYRWSPADDLVQVSTDHSVVAELVAEGSISPEEAESHPERNAITRALGIDEGVQPDVWTIEPAAGDRYLICSDGLVREVPDTDIGEELGARRDPSDSAKRLLDAALSSGAQDNVSVVIVDVVNSGADKVDADGDTRPSGGGSDTRPREGRSVA